MRFLAQREHVLVEGSAAVGVAAVLGGRLRIDGPLAVVLTGRNVALAVLQQYVFA
jgi:threonine dehydratase